MSKKEKKKPTLKELFKGEVLNGYLEAARVKPLTAFAKKEPEDLTKVESWREWSKDFTTYKERVQFYVREVGIPLKILKKIPDYPTTAVCEDFIQKHETEIRDAWEKEQPVVVLKELIENFLIKEA